MWYFFGVMWTLIAICQAQEISAPYQISIRSNETAIVGNATVGGQLTNICSGVIIKAEYILTTAGCTYIQDKLTNLSRVIHPNEISIYAGYISLGRISFGNHESVQRNVISVIPHPKYNSTTLENDIALLKLDRPLPLHNSTAVQWIELQQPQRTSFAHSNNVNENCFTNVYNNSVGALNYPFTLVSNVSHVDAKFCSDHHRELKFNESCWEYRLNGINICQSDPAALRRSEDRGTAIVCNFKLAAILAEINPPANPQSCNQIKYTTAFYTPVEFYREWIENESGSLYSVGFPGATGTVFSGTSSSGGAILPPNPSKAPANPWTESHNPEAPSNTKPSGKRSSAVTISDPGIVSKLIPFNLFIAFVYGFHWC
ncbi:trypsin-like [Wyeomyia smithii]|uniref:trypsin-like n=1 Tax=Wyeomyia smithii TaxID=174621 RepID=UPI002467E1CB|nr:trypsin-like [Wyeomyia smithii]